MVTVGAEEDDKKENNDVLISALKKMFPDENTASFFQHGTKNCGKSYIASCQLTKTDNPSVVSELDTELHLLLASLLLRITKGERYLLSQIMSRVVQKIVKDVTENSGLNEGDETARKTVKHLQIPLPSSENEFRQYLDGTTAIINKIPTPTIRVTADGDAYVLVSDVIRLYFGLGIKPHMIKTEADITRNGGTITTAWQSKKATEALRSLVTKDDSTYKILLADWSDSFDPNGANKNNRGSVHAITCSLLCEDNRNNRDLSFLVGLSNDKSDHMEVRRAMYKDLKELAEPTMVFDGTKMMRIQVVHLVTIQDRPERSASTGFGYHTGKNTMVWGWSTRTVRSLISCSNCFQDRCSKYESGKSSRCSDCYDWDWSKVSYSPPDGYPTDLLARAIKNRPVTFAGMKKAAQTAHINVRTKKWNQAGAATYLKIEGFHTNLIKAINNCTTDDELKAILPPVWDSNGDFSTHIDTIMHQIFLGVTQTVGMIMKDVLTSCSLFSKFHKSDHQLRNIRSLQLDWCKTWVFGSSNTPFGPWVSENTLAYARAIKSTYCILYEVKDKDIQDLSFMLIQSWIAVVSRIMQDAVDDDLIQSLQRHIKIFLSILCDVEIALDKKKLKIQTTSNINSLLNICSYMKEYGPLRLYWEGSFKGEGLLQYVKPMVKQGTHKSTFGKNTMKAYYKDRFFQTVLRIDLKDDEDEDEDKKNLRYNKFYIYSSKKKIEEKMSNGDAMSVVILKSDIICAVYKQYKEHFGLAIVPNDKRGKLVRGTYATALQTGKTIKVTRQQLALDTFVKAYALALPLPAPEAKINCLDVTQMTTGHVYYIVTDAWRERLFDERKKEAKYILPRINNCKYNNTN